VASLFMFIGCSHISRVLQRDVLLHVTVCVTSRLKFFICTVPLLVHYLKINKNPLDSLGLWLDSTRSVCSLSTHQLNKSDSTWLDATLLMSTEPILFIFTSLYVGSGSLYKRLIFTVFTGACFVIQYSCSIV
jgi:hypothetical protein